MKQHTPYPSESLNFVLQNESTVFVISEELSENQLRQVLLKSLETVARQYEEDHDCVEITVRIVDTEEARQFNQQYRQKDYATNVLTFEYGKDTTNTLRADIVICAPVVKQEALEQDKVFAEHFKHLLVHGALHALGFDHQSDEDAEDMESLEAEILAQFQIKNPYL